jgi:hypothetical protein
MLYRKNIHIGTHRHAHTHMYTYQNLKKIMMDSRNSSTCGIYIT